jgi:ABC-2 type transport system ATP-binding protein
MKSAIVAEGLVQRYGRRTVLDGLSMEVEEGAVYALVGANGAGKTTTIKTLLGLLPAVGGRAWVAGAESREEIGVVSEWLKLPLGMAAGEYLDYWRPFYGRWDGGLERELVKQFELPLERKLKELSRGMRMKALLVSVLAARPRVLMLDEPFSGLDAAVRDELIAGLLGRADEMTVLISSHDLAEIETFASHAGYLEDGRLKFSEEMGGLVSRFREVEVTVGAAPQLPAEWPATWLAGETAGAVVRFVDTAHEAGRLEAEVARLWPGARVVEARPMALRAIFVALARGRKQAA